MKQTNDKPRIATAALFAAVVLPIAPVHGQELPPPVVAPPPPVVAPPPPVTTAPPPVVTTAPPPAARTTPPPQATPADEPRAETRRARTPARRATAAPAPAPAAEPAPPPAATESAPPAAEPALVPVPPVAAPAQTAQGAGAADLGGIAPWTWILALLALAAAAIALLTRGRRRAVVENEKLDPAPAVAAPVAPAIEPQPYVAPYVAPVLVDEPMERDFADLEVAETAAVDAKPAVDSIDVGAPAEGDVAAMAAASEPGANRPWLEMLMRPLRAGTTSDDAVVEFELTVGNTGSEAARDVRISTWMFPAGADGASEMERLLIDSESSIEPGDGTRVSAAITLSKASLSEAVLPVVVADARYRLADGSEGRTSASFAVGMPRGGELAPFPVDRSSGLLETVEARLHGDLERD